MVDITRHKKQSPFLTDFEHMFENWPSLWGERAPFWDPREELERAWHRYKYWEDRWKREYAPMLAGKSVSYDLEDKGDKFVLTADLPGLKKDEVKVNISGNAVEISAEHKESKEQKSKKLIRSERSQANYYRYISIPEDVKGDKTTAKMVDGCLTLVLPKKVPRKSDSPVEVKVQ